jgi:hypothetical protein
MYEKPSSTQTSRAVIGLLTACAATLKFAAAAGAAGMIWIHLCGSWTPGGGNTGGSIGVARSGSSNPGVSTPYQCPTTATGSANGMEVFGGGSNVPAGARAYWQIDAPAGLVIVGVHTEGSGMISYGVNANMGWGGGFYWQGGGAGARQSEIAYSSPPLFSTYFGWQIICGWSTCDGNSKPGEISILGLEIEAAESSGPSVSPTPGTLGAASGWARSWWPVGFAADGPSGACQLTASLGGVSVSQPVTEPQSQTTWHQCSAGSFSQSFNTASVSSGPSVPLVMWARDAAYDYSAGAYLSGSVTKYVNIDNDPISVTLSGPTDAPSTARTQYVTATATAGPSQVQGIACSTDGAPNQWYPGASARVPVSGIGSHGVRCAADNNAVDPAGNHGWSSWASWNLSIRQPTVSAIGFSKLVDALRCRRVRERISVRATWVTVHRHGRLVRVHRRAHTKVVKVVRCHPRIAHRKIVVWTTVRRHGRPVRVKRAKMVRVILRPHVITRTSEWVAHGRGTTVSGWVGLSSNIALGGQTVRVMTAPDNGLDAFTQAAVVTTASNGSWSAHLPAGPSRLVEAVYDGGPTTEPSTSGQVRVVVPALVELISVWPRRVPWSSPGHPGAVRIVGRLVGGYLPPGGALVRMRIGSGSHYTTYGVQEYVTGNGRFSTSYTFGDGLPSVYQTFWFEISSLPMGGDYPYAPADSRKLTVLVGGHPAVLSPLSEVVSVRGS